MKKPKSANANHERSRILDNAADTWRFLEDQAGFDPVFYDAPIVSTLRSALGLSADEDIGEGLARKAISIEDFVAIFFAAVEPYALMMTDLLNLFTEVGARHSDHNLKVEFDFGKDVKLGFDLREFRDWLAVWDRARRHEEQIRWNSKSLWELCEVLRRDLRPRKHFMGGRNSMGAEGTDAETWAREYAAGHWPEGTLPPPLSGNVDLDGALHRAWQVWSKVIAESARISRNRTRLQEIRHQVLTESLGDRQGRTEGATDEETEPLQVREEDERWASRLLAELDSDGWALAIASALYGTNETLAEMGPPARSAFSHKKISMISDLFAQQPRTTDDIESWKQVVLDFLNLPVWRRRHELYSAWIWTQIVEALRDLDHRSHQRNGSIHFSFAGTHLTTFPQLDPELHIWAELRSPLAETPWGKGRKGKIQPDYTLVQNPITSKDSAVVVVECKQYRTASTENFLHAVVDYAHGRPTAQVILVNYGPTRDEILDKAPEDIRGRLLLIGEMRPRTPAVTRFHEIVRAAAALRYPAVKMAADLRPEVQSAARDAVAPLIKAITLCWNEGPYDLDLCLSAVQNGSESLISYSNKGSLSTRPWAELDTDARSGGRETIMISQLVGQYYCYVYAYSTDALLASSRAEVRIELAAGSIVLNCPQQGSGRYWHIFELNGETGKLEILNTLSDSR